MSPPKVIIDTDAGIDDALAICMAITAHKQNRIEIVALTTVHGNTQVHNVNNNVLRILETVDLLHEIPVYTGASESLVIPFKYIEEPFHGYDGFGDARFAKPPPSITHLQEQHAVWALVNLAKKYSGNVVVAALGPLTNLALAMKLDPTFLSNLSDLYVMGGNTSGRGNITVCGEFNFTCDPEAAKVVLEGAPKPIYLTPWEICLYQTKLPYETRMDMGSVKTPEAELINMIEHKGITRRRFDEWITCDQLAMAWMIDNLTKPPLAAGETSISDSERIAQEIKKYYATVELQGSITRGLMAIDHENYLKKSPNVIILTKANMDLYQRYLRMAFGGKVVDHFS